MIGKAWQYKWLNFTDSIQVTSQQSNWYSYIIQDVVKNVPLRTQTYDRANFHWWYSSNTLAWSRLFSFTGKVIWTNKDKRNMVLALLMAKIQPEWNPDIQNRWFYDLSWLTDWWDNRTCKAKVYTMLNPTNWLDDPIIEYTFELYSETEKIYDPTTQLITWARAFFGWITLPIPLPTYLAWYAWAIPVTNNWDWYAPCKIQIVWQATNPQIINLTNNNKYRVGWVTTNLVLDNTNLNNDPLKLLVVTDNGADIKSQRRSGSDIFLNPWLNHIAILTDVPTETPIVYITFRDTYIR